MGKVYVFFAEGFEEIEGLTVVDMLRREGIDTIMVSIEGDKRVTGAHMIPVVTDRLFEELDFSDGEMLVLPGGMPGTKNLMKHSGLLALLRSFNKQKKYLAAICAAPTVFGSTGILVGRHATCFPGFEKDLTGAKVLTDEVVIDGNLITSRGMGTAISFSAALIGKLTSFERAEELLKKIVYKQK